MALDLVPATGPPCNGPLVLAAENVCGIPTLRASGEIDMASAPALRSALMRTLGSDDLICDMRGVGFIDSTGMEVLLDARSVALETGCVLTLLASPAVRRVAELLDVEGYLLGAVPA
jgi:anti-sigma B factor antagonist